MNDFTNQICLVTGGNQGIGWAITQALASQGARVYSCGLSQRSLDKASQELLTLPWRESIFLSRCDVSDRAALEEWIRAVYQETGRIDILVNNAAFVRWTDIDEMSVEDALTTMRVSYEGMVVSIKAVLPLMKAAGRGHIVNIGSMTARILVPGSSAAYTAAKAAVDAYTLMMQIELADSPVGATLVRLSTIAGTNFFKEHVPPSRMSPFTRFLPALTPPRVADGIVKAIKKKQRILTLPGYMGLLGVIYQLAPGFSRWLAQFGGSNQHDYGAVSWQDPRDK